MKKILLLGMFISIMNIVVFAQQGITNDTKCTTCFKTIVTGENASALGQFTTSTGLASFASGNSSTASGNYSTAFGDNSKATNISAFSAGSFAEANGVYSLSLGRYTFANAQSSVAIGKYIEVTPQSSSAVAIGKYITGSASYTLTLGTGNANDKRLENNVSESLMIGFNSELPTFFVGKSLGADRTGNIGIGNITLPESKLHIKADDNEDASVYLQPTNSNYYGKIFLGDKNNMISAKSGGDIEFETISGRDFGFIKGNIIHDAGLYIATSKIMAPDASGLSLTNMSGNGIFVDDGGNVKMGSATSTSNVTVFGLTQIHQSLAVQGDCDFTSDLLVQGNIGIGIQPNEKLEVDGNILQTAEHNLATSQIKAPDANGLSLTDQNGNGIFVDDGGNVGIGITPNNAYALDVNGPVNFLGNLYQNGQVFETTKWGENGTDIYYNQGNVGINTQSPVTNLDIKGDIALGKPGEKFLLHSRPWEGDKFMIVPQNNGSNWEFDKSFTLFDNGNVGIGVSDIANATAKLTVKGNIHAREVLVTLNAGGADFVFDENYKLPGLDDIEDYIATNKHLPDIPSAKQMQEDGLELGDMQIKMLQKIEELTLYVIEQNKKIEKLEGEVSKLREE